MNCRLIFTAGVFCILAFAWSSSASATIIMVNSATVFATDYETDTATPLTFANAGNTDANDLDPSSTLVGSWNTGLGGTGTFEKRVAVTAGAGYVVSSKQVQVTSSMTGPDPGPLQGTNYLRGFRNSPAAQYSNLWEVSPASFVTDGNDDIAFESAVFATTTTTPLTLATLYNNETAFGVRARLNVNATGDLVTSTGFDTGLNFTYAQWKVMRMSYTEGASTWSLTYDGNTATGLPLTALGAGSVTFLSYGGGGGVAAGTTVYFDAVPEPSVYTFSRLGMLGLGFVRRRKLK